MLGSTHDAADATQQTFVRVLKRLPSLQGPVTTTTSSSSSTTTNPFNGQPGGPA